MIRIKLHDYSYECSDGCCTWFGTRIFVNDVELDTDSQDTGNIVKAILEHLGHEDVEIEETFDYE